MTRIGRNQKGWDLVKEFDVTELDVVMLQMITKMAAEAGETMPSVGWSYDVNGGGTGGKLALYKRTPPAS